jgi:hypothetical protein
MKSDASLRQTRRAAGLKPICESQRRGHDRRRPTRGRYRQRPHSPKESVSRGVGTVESGEVGRGWAHIGSIVAQGGSGLRRAGRSRLPLRTGRQEAADAQRSLGRYYGSPSDRAFVETSAFCQHRASDRQEERHRGTGRRRRRRRARKPHEARARGHPGPKDGQDAYGGEAVSTSSSATRARRRSATARGYSDRDST